MVLSIIRNFSLLFLILLLSACGGGSNGNPAVSSVPATLTPAVDNNAGGFQAISAGVFNSKVQIQRVINAQAGLNNQQYQALYGVHAYRIDYITQDEQNSLLRVSGLIVIPDKVSASAIISYQHPTLFKNQDAPSFHLQANDRSIELALASQGYIVIAADYIGYGASFGHPHPYLQKQPASNVVIDLLKAAKAWLDVNQIQTDGRVFVAGYSQGGYVSMAAMQALQNNPISGLQVVTAALGAGPYDLETALDTLLLGINVPDPLQNLAIATLERIFIRQDADVAFERTFLQRYFQGDRQDNVHQWRPDYRVILFHGKDDRTVPIESAESTLATMKNLGADIALIPCRASPADHLNCVVPYLDFMMGYFRQF